MSINIHGSVPLYKQLAENFRNEIMDGKWERGAMLPSENELVAEYKVSRATIRNCMNLLEQDNLIEKRQGRGTFVKTPLFDQDFKDSHSYIEEIKKIGKEPTFEIAKLSCEVSPKTLSEIFGLEAGAKLWRIERIKKADGIPIMFERIYLPVHIAPDLTKGELEEKWLRDLLIEKYGISFGRVKKIIEPIVISEYEANWLDLRPRSLGLLVDRLTWSNEKVTLVTRSVVRSDVARYTIELDHNVQF